MALLNATALGPSDKTSELPTEDSEEDRLARRMEALLSNGWLQYLTHNTHGSGFPRNTQCEVSFRRTQHGDRRLIIVVRRPLTKSEIAWGATGDANHPGKILHFPKPDYWFWPGLEDEAIARKVRGLPRKITGLRGHIYLTDGHALKPY